MKKFLFLVLGFIILTSSIMVAEGASISTNVTSVSIWDMIIFRGEGFHRLHNVEITIYQEDVVISKLLTKTTNKGVLFIPLIVTDLSPGEYDVLATDKIHIATTSFNI